MQQHHRTIYNRLLNEHIHELRAKARINATDVERFHAAVVQAALDRHHTTRPSRR